MKEVHCRNTNIELLRLVLMICICGWHVIIHGYEFKNIGYSNTGIDISLFHCFLLSFFAPSVYCFMFISGWFGISFKYRKYAYLVFVSFVIYVLGTIVHYFLTCELDIYSITRHVFPIATKQWWFLTGYAMVFCLAPFINTGLANYEKKTVLQIIFILTGLEVLSFVTLEKNSGSTFLGLLYMYILGRYMNVIKYRISTGKALSIFLAGLIIMTISIFLFKESCHKAYAFTILGYNNIVIILMSISMFFIVNNLKPYYNKLINTILSPMLVIYLLTEIIGVPLYYFLKQSFENSFLLGLSCILLIVLLCLFIGGILKIIYFRFVEQCITNKIMHYIKIN